MGRPSCRTPSWAVALLEGMRALTTEVTRLGRAYAQVAKEIRRMANELDTLTAQVKANTDVVESALLLIKGLRDKLDQAGTDPAKLKALSDELTAADQKLADAVAANTSADPNA